MAADSNAVEQAVSRTLRDNLERIQRATDDLHQAIADVVAACASSKPSNALPPLVRAQTGAASLSAALEVLSRFVTSSLQPIARLPAEKETLGVTSLPVPEPSVPPAMPEPSVPQPMAEQPWAALPPVDFPASDSPKPAEAFTPEVPAPDPPAVETPASQESVHEVPATNVSSSGVETLDELATSPEAASEENAAPAAGEEAVTGMSVAEPETEAPALPGEEEPKELQFDVASLPPDEQEMHRRAYRVAKVTMQDIKMLRPDDVRLGRENMDLCLRLHDDIEKAHKEYDRRFHSILEHPVDYFYDWMVEILAGGDPEALGEYPYSSPVLRR